MNEERGNTSGPLLMEKMADEGTISANKYSFYFQETTEESWMDLGEPIMSNIKANSYLVETQMIEEDFFYGFYNTGIAIG